ncbi:MAG: NfeD family protein [Thermotogae bacterium]|nr:NfeD family protein [Thermotogota bacterium]
MQEWGIWIILGIVFAVVELLTPTFFFFWFSVGSVITAVLSVFVESSIINTFVFLFISFVLWLLTRKFTKKIYKHSSDRNTFEYDLNNREGIVTEVEENNKYIVKVLGEEWLAVSEEKLIKNDYITVIKKESNILYVKKLYKEE